MRSTGGSAWSLHLSLLTVVALFTGLVPRVSAGQTATYALSVSGSANRSGAIALQGSTLTGSAHVFTSSATDLQQATPAGVSRVCFWLDDPAMAGGAARCEGATPYDFAGSESSSSTSLALAWNTTRVADGSHTITQLVTRTTGTTESASAVFTVRNLAAPALPTLVALAVSPATVTGGQAATGTVTLDGAAPSGGTLVTLISDNPVAQVPSTVTVAAGSRTASFAVVTTPVAATTVATLAGSLDGVRKATSLTVAAFQTGTYALSVSTSANRSGAIALQGSTLAGAAYVFTSSASDLQQATPAGVGRVCFWLDDPAMVGGAFRCEGAMPYDFAGSDSGSSTALALAWDTTRVPDGSHTITQLVTTTTGTTESASAVVTVRNLGTPALPTLVALAVSPATVTGGQAATGTVTLDGAAPSGGTLVALTSDSLVAQVPPSVTVPAGSRSGSFAIATNPVAATAVATLAGSLDGVRQAASLTVTAPQGPIYALSVSASANRSGAIALQGSTLTGIAYVFTSSAADLQQATPAGITRVCFWLDDPAMVGGAARCEGAMPYDFAGSVGSTSTSLALAWDTTWVANGSHTITQLVTRTTGAGELHSDDFTIQNTLSEGEPTVESASRRGPFAVVSYSTGIPLGENSVNPKIYFPSNGTPPYPAVVFVAGYCETYASRAAQGHNFLQWGTLLASHGIIVLFVDSAPDGCGGIKELTLTEGMATLVSESERAGGPLFGNVDTSRLAVMGHSSGGGAALNVANDNSDPRLKTAVGLTPVMNRGFYPDDRVPSLLIAGEGDPKGPNSLGQYESIPATTPKLLAEFAPVSTVQISMHHIADTPLGTNVTDPVVARIGLSYLKEYLADDVRYLQFLVPDPSLSTFLMVP